MRSWVRLWSESAAYRVADSVVVLRARHQGRHDCVVQRARADKPGRVGRRPTHVRHCVGQEAPGRMRRQGASSRAPGHLRPPKVPGRPLHGVPAAHAYADQRQNSPTNVHLSRAVHAVSQAAIAVLTAGRAVMRKPCCVALSSRMAAPGSLSACMQQMLHQTCYACAAHRSAAAMARCRCCGLLGSCRRTGALRARTRLAENCVARVTFRMKRATTSCR